MQDVPPSKIFRMKFNEGVAISVVPWAVEFWLVFVKVIQIEAVASLLSIHAVKDQMDQDFIVFLPWGEAASRCPIPRKESSSCHPDLRATVHSSATAV